MLRIKRCGEILSGGSEGSQRGTQMTRLWAGGYADGLGESGREAIPSQDSLRTLWLWTASRSCLVARTDGTQTSSDPAPKMRSRADCLTRTRLPTLTAGSEPGRSSSARFAG